jgi:phage gp36-like protein
MAYATNQELIDRVGSAAAAQLSAEGGATPDQDVLTEMRTDAEREVDGYLAKKIAVPVDTTGEADRAAKLKTLTLDVAVYRLHGRRGSAIPSAVEAVYKNAIEWLTGFAEGKHNLPGTSTPASQTSDKPVAAWGGSPATMSRTNAGIGSTSED